MATDYQRYVAIGRTTKDMKFKILGNGTAVANFDLAINRSDNKNTDYISCVIWGEGAKKFNDNVGKGSLILVDGEFRSSIVDYGDGTKRKELQLELSFRDSKWLDLKPPTSSSSSSQDN